MNFKVLLRAILIGFLLFTLVGCKAKLSSGLYVGTFSKMDGNHFTQTPVSIQIDLKGSYSADLEIRDIQKTLIDQGHIHWDKWKDTLRLTLPKLHLNSLGLNRVSLKTHGDIRWRCYQGVSSQALSLCMSRHNFILNVTDLRTKDLLYSLSADFSAQQTSFTLEDPKPYQLSEAIGLAQSKSFEVQIEYQRLIQAKEAARAAYMNLLPHANYKTILAGTGFNLQNLQGMLNFVADFVPFVIPTRWLKAKEAGDMREAEKATLEILKADLVNQISGLSYLYTQDHMDYSFFQDLLEKSTAVLNHVREMNQPNSPVWDELNFRMFTLTNIMEQELLRLENAVKLDRTGIALSLGLHNPDAVTDLDIQEDPTSIENAEELVERDIGLAAVERSLELWQLNHLIHNAKLQKEEYYFNWADPDVASSMSVSLSIIPYAAKAQAFVDELLKKREQTQSQIMQKAQNAVTNYNLSLQRYKKIKVGQEWLSTRVNEIYQDILAAKSVQDLHTSGPNLQWALQTYVQNMLSLHATLARYRVARAQIQRVLLEKHYTRYQTKEYKPLLKSY